MIWRGLAINTMDNQKIDSYTQTWSGKGRKEETTVVITETRGRIMGKTNMFTHKCQEYES